MASCSDKMASDQMMSVVPHVIQHINNDDYDIH